MKIPKVFVECCRNMLHQLLGGMYMSNEKLNEDAKFRTNLWY